MKFIYHDGGRKAAGFKGDTGDCVVRAVAIATGLPYIRVCEELHVVAEKERLTKGRKSKSSVRGGVWKPTTKRLLQRLGWVWTPTMQIGSGCTVHLRADELPAGRLIVSVSRHLTTVIDGVIYDTYDPSREGTRCVYGYWQQEGGR